MDRLIMEVLEVRSGKTLSSEEVFARSEREIFNRRRELSEAYRSNANPLICTLCHQPVLIAGTVKQEFFFKHRQELGDCPIKTKGKYSQEEINRMKYNGVKESEAHRQLKTFIYRSLLDDDRFLEVGLEEVVKGGGLAKEWKKPDVTSQYGDKPLVWEIQLSTTFLNVIVDRESFYRENGTYIMWVFNEFDTERLRFTEKDIYWQNKANAFVIDDRTMTLSLERGELVLDCRYLVPDLRGGTIVQHWESRDVTIADLTFDPETYKVYYHDLDKARSDIELERVRLELQEFEEYWLTRARLDFETAESRDIKYCRLLSRLQPVRVERFDRRLAGVLDALYSAKHGRVIGSNFQNLNSVANNILEHYKDFTHVFGWALRTFGRLANIEAADKKGSYKAKTDRYIQGVRKRDPEYKQNKDVNQIFKLLFPELSDHL